MAQFHFDPCDWASIEPHYQALLDAPLDADSAIAWLQQWSDLEAQLYEAQARAFWAMTIDTSNTTAAEQYQHILATIKPQAEQFAHKLKVKILALDEFVPPADLVVMLQQMRCEVALHREELAAQRVEIETRAQQYLKITSAVTIVVDDQAMTLSQARARLFEPDRALRERSWRAMIKAQLQNYTPLEALFLQLRANRQQLAQDAGFFDYRAYRWQELKRFDYTPDMCLELHEYVATAFVPLRKQLLEQRRVQLGVETVRAWDSKADPHGRLPLRPFETVQALEAGLARVFNHMDPELGALFSCMRSGNIDLESRPGKTPLLGYSERLPWSKQALIFLNLAGASDDVRVFVHETGHAFHSLIAQRNHPFLWQYVPPLEFAEVASQAMEFLILPYLAAEQGGWYNSVDAQRVRIQQYSGVVDFLLTATSVDALQHWLYTEAPANVSAAMIDEQFKRIVQRFLPGEDWSGLEATQGTDWRFQLLPFIRPFYMIEYVLSNLAALQIARNAQQNPAVALSRYRDALSFGNTRTISELYAAAGAQFAFDQSTVHSLAAFVAEQIELD